MTPLARDLLSIAAIFAGTVVGTRLNLPAVRKAIMDTLKQIGCPRAPVPPSAHPITARIDK